MEKRDIYTLRELKLLAYLQKHPCDYLELMKVLKTDEDGVNILLSSTVGLHACKPPDGYLEKDSTISLTDLGETVVRAEKERRFDTFFTRSVSLLALAVSVVAIIVEVIGK